MKNTSIVILEAAGGATVDQVIADAEWLRTLLRDNECRFLTVIVRHNDRYYQQRVEEIEHK